MKVAVDTGPLKSGDSVRGIGVYTRELIDAMQKAGGNVFEIQPIDYFNHQSSTINHFSAVHLTRFNPFYVCLPFNKPKHTKFVMTIYDLIPLIYPDHYQPGVKGWISWQINKFLIKRNVDAVITISETSKKDICRFIGINPDRVNVIHLAPRSIFRKLAIGNWKSEITKTYGLPESFVLYVGDVNYNKNIPLLIAACKQAKISLVICGKQAKEIDKLDLNHPELRHLKGVDWTGVVRVGFVSDDDLVKIYNLASVYIQPSLYEGFGFPVLEANAAGTPVICSKTQALVEITSGAAVFTDPKNSKDLSKKIKLLMSDYELRNKLASDGLENAKKYSWKLTAERTIKVYEKIRI